MVWYSHLFKNLLVCCNLHTVKGFSLVNEAEVDFFFFLIPLLFLLSRCWQFHLWFLPLSNSNLYIWNFSVHVLLKPSMKDFEHNLAFFYIPNLIIPTSLPCLVLMSAVSNYVALPFFFFSLKLDMMYWLKGTVINRPLEMW